MREVRIRTWTGRGARLAAVAAAGAVVLSGCSFEFSLGGEESPTSTSSAASAPTRESRQTAGRSATPSAPSAPSSVPSAPAPSATTEPAPESSAPAAGGGRAINGTWAGTVSQAGHDPYIVRATIAGAPGRQTASVEYPDLGCRANWTITPDGDSGYTVSEDVYSGGCVDDVTITLKQTGADQMSYEVASPHASATLSRK